jgi:hypothetical protein
MIGKLLLAGAASAAALSMSVLPAAAHDCFNPTKNAHAPMAGVHYELTGFNPDGSPILVQLGTAKGVGGFALIAPGVIGNPVTVETHTLGAGNNPHGVVGGPGSQKPSHACNGKGIDYLDVCFGAG